MHDHMCLAARPLNWKNNSKELEVFPGWTGPFRIAVGGQLFQIETQTTLGDIGSDLNLPSHFRVTL